jgi:hypothetical protein
MRMSRVPAARRKNKQTTSGLAAMEARSVDAIPRGTEWQYEPKWDGFRCLLSRNAGGVALRSKSGEDLTRYFPELVEAALRLKAAQFTLDGEIVVPHGKTFSFDDLLQRIHPAQSRITKFAADSGAVSDLRSFSHGERQEARRATARQAAAGAGSLRKDSIQVADHVSALAGNDKLCHCNEMAGGGWRRL